MNSNPASACRWGIGVPNVRKAFRSQGFRAFFVEVK
jgi:hypothetical protein